MQKLEETTVVILTAFKHLAQSLQGEAPAPDFGAVASREIGTVPFTTACSYYISAIQYHYLMGNHREGLRIAALIAKDIENIAGEIAYSEHHFYHTLCITASWPELHPRERRRNRRILHQYRSSFRKWSRMGPQNFEHRRLILEAEIARLCGSPARAMQLYEAAIRAATENGYPQDQAVANLLASTFYRGQKMEKVAASFLEEACQGFTSWGATAVVGSSGKDMPARALPGRGKARLRRQRPRPRLSPSEERQLRGRCFILPRRKQNMPPRWTWPR